MSVKNNRELYQRCGQHDALLHRLQEKRIRNEIEVASYGEAIRKYFGKELLFEYAFGLEKQFPPGIAFTDMIEGQPELQRDFNRNKELVFFGIAKYEVNDTTRKVYRDVYGEELNDSALPVMVGYSMAVDVSRIPEFHKINIRRYMSSAIVDHRFRTKGVAHKMVVPTLREFDSNETGSFLTTWCHNGTKTHHSYYPPIEFWLREGYEFLDKKSIGKIVSGIKKMHIKEGIIGRNYNLREIEIKNLNLSRNNGLDLNRKIGAFEDYYEPIGYGEKRWDGIVMIRTWNKNIKSKTFNT